MSTTSTNVASMLYLHPDYLWFLRKIQARNLPVRQPIFRNSMQWEFIGATKKTRIVQKIRYTKALAFGEELKLFLQVSDNEGYSVTVSRYSVSSGSFKK
ncbi:unnamed protein product [Strongylus vulgaris]|uniref:Uncharacterized protein n=1 Tax=Strongylus vulgaris TaxID=40348 RepID=A0A3P7KZY1_STRVU|nr:unnamed protein product [Strongylus vulgaris]